MLVSDLALRLDPAYGPIAKAWSEDFKGLTDAFAAAWCEYYSFPPVSHPQFPSVEQSVLTRGERYPIIVKLTHRDMGPVTRYLGPEVPKQRFSWQDPLPAVHYQPINAADQAKLKTQILAKPGLTVSALVSVAWGSASTFRNGDKRGGCNGARIALKPQVSWEVNNPKQLQAVLSAVCFIPTPEPSRLVITIANMSTDSRPS